MQNRFFITPLSMLLAICSIALFLFTPPSFAQEPPPSLTQIRNLTPEQQFNYVNEARRRGYSLVQLEGLAKAQGASLEDLYLLRTAWSDSQSGGVVEDQAKNSQVVEKPLMFGNEPGMFFSFEKKEPSDIFGSAFLQTKTSLKPHSFMWLPLRAIV